MNHFTREQVLRVYRGLTFTHRSRQMRRLEEVNGCPAFVLFYHRIADEHPNGWTMSCEDFARQLDWLEANFEVVDLRSIQSRIREGSHRPSVAITFDDGYADNADFAIPELVRRGLPATYFVATDFVIDQKPFPHDVQTGVPLAPNTVEQIQGFAEAGIEIGAHTRSHCDIGQVLDSKQVEYEIVGSKDILESWLGSKIRYFAFPFGLPENMTEIGANVIVNAGFDGFCSAYGAINWPEASPFSTSANGEGSAFHIRRIHGDPGIERLKNWLTLDPRKLEDASELPFDESKLSLAAAT
ncbi:MAG: polysaccharide deacetylase family protein [Aureliella sp.]